MAAPLLEVAGLREALGARVGGAQDDDIQASECSVPMMKMRSPI
jgi:hypothetical protein